MAFIVNKLVGAKPAVALISWNWGRKVVSHSFDSQGVGTCSQSCSWNSQMGEENGTFHEFMFNNCMF
jgi:hypothetical protein